MMQIKLRVRFIDGSEHEDGEYTVTPAVQVAFEREFKIGVAKAFGSDGMRNEHLFWLGWKAMHNSGRVVKPFDSWLAELVGVELVNEPHPTGATL